MDVSSKVTKIEHSQTQKSNFKYVLEENMERPNVHMGMLHAPYPSPIPMLSNANLIKCASTLNRTINYCRFFDPINNLLLIRLAVDIRFHPVKCGIEMKNDCPFISFPYSMSQKFKF